MKGYFTFLVVFAACLLTVSLVLFNINTKYSNSANSIWVERYYQSEMNIKEAVVEAIREGTIEGIILYSADYVTKGCAARLADGDASAVPNIDCIGHYVNKKAIEKINALNGQEVNGMKFLVSIDQQYAPSIDSMVCENQPCGTSSISTEKRVVEIFNLDLQSLPIDSTSMSVSECEDALKGATVQIKKDPYTQQSPIYITIQNAEFDDVTFNMPPIEIEWG